MKPFAFATLVLATGAGLLPAPGAAQWLAPPMDPPAPTGAPIHPGARSGGGATLTLSPACYEEGLAAMGWAGFLGSALGFAGGAFLGYHGERFTQPLHGGGGDDPGLMGLILGSFVGPAFLAPVAVHGTNGGRGSLHAGWAVGSLVAGVGAAATLLTAGSEAGLVPLFGTPVAQWVSAVVTESRTAESAWIRSHGACTVNGVRTGS